jgi:hypothetical protein
VVIYLCDRLLYLLLFICIRWTLPQSADCR